jgi:hypothetical protein
MGHDATTDAIKLRTKLGHGDVKAAWDKFDANVLVAAVVVGVAVGICLRKAGASAGPATLAMQHFRPLVPLGHLPSMPQSEIQNWSLMTGTNI